MESKFKIAVLVSGHGTNLQEIIKNINLGKLNVKIDLVISDNSEAYGLEIAKSNGIDTLVLDRKEYKNTISDEILKVLENKVDLIVLAGWLSILQGNLIRKFRNKIINIHPSLIPSFCGKGMYGLKVHEKVLEYGVKFSGCTVHFVYEEVDNGPIIIQKAVPVFDYDTPKDLQERVLVKEHEALSEAINLIAEDKIEIIDRKVQLKRCLN